MAQQKEEHCLRKALLQSSEGKDQNSPKNRQMPRQASYRRWQDWGFREMEGWGDRKVGPVAQIGRVTPDPGHRHNPTQVSQLEPGSV